MKGLAEQSTRAVYRCSVCPVVKVVVVVVVVVGGEQTALVPLAGPGMLCCPPQATTATAEYRNIGSKVKSRQQDGPVMMCCSLLAHQLLVVFLVRHNVTFLNHQLLLKH